VLLVSTGCLCVPEVAQPERVSVPSTQETLPVPHSGDAADDPAIWIHPDDPALSVVIGSDKSGGIAVYDLAGDELQYRPDGRVNNLDVRHGFVLGDALVDLVAGSNRTGDTIAVYRVDPETRSLVSVAEGGGISSNLEVYGFCMYRSPVTRKHYAFVNSQGGRVEQWELFDTGQGTVDGILVREWETGSQTEGCVADDEYGDFYIGEEAVGIWRYGAEPGDGEARVLVDTTAEGGHLSADVEGLTLYYDSQGGGYLIASSQGSDDYVLYRRDGDNAYVGTFEIVDGNGIDGTSATDGIDVSNANLGPGFPSGLFVAQDDDNQDQSQNFKLVPWESIAEAFSTPLTIDTAWDPRPAACDDRFDNDGDTLVDHPADPDCDSALDDSEHPVPEPSASLLWLAALGALGLLARRRLRRAATSR
jgi:3-phytase